VFILIDRRLNSVRLVLVFWYFAQRMFTDGIILEMSRLFAPLIANFALCSTLWAVELSDNSEAKIWLIYHSACVVDHEWNPMPVADRNLVGYRAGWYVADPDLVWFLDHVTAP
jgi:hypothetical protein